jgi:hypothetical protein
MDVSASIERKKIFQLEQDEGTTVGEENLKVFISEYYKGLFGAPPPPESLHSSGRKD